MSEEQKKHVYGPFKASIHTQGETQRGVFFPKKFHKEKEFLKLMSKHKHAITIIIEPVSTLDPPKPVTKKPD